MIVSVYTPGRRLCMTNLPSASVSPCVFPPLLVHGLNSQCHTTPCHSHPKLCRRSIRVCAAAFGARTATKDPRKQRSKRRTSKSLHHPPFCRGIPSPAWLARDALLSLILVFSKSLECPTSRGDSQPVRDGVRHSCLRKCLQSEQATIARSASLVFILVARPSQMQRCAQIDTAPDNLRFFFKVITGCGNFDLRLRPRPHSHQTS